MIHIHKLKGFSPAVLIAAYFLAPKTILHCHDHELLNPDAAESGKIGQYFRDYKVLYILYILPRMIALLFVGTIICPSVYIKNKIELIYPKFISRKIVVIPNSIKNINSIAMNDPNYFDKRLLSIVYLGRLEEDKGIKILIEAFTKAVSYDETLRLDIYGYGSLKSWLENVIKDIPEISFKGQLDESNKSNLSRYDYLINPSLCQESFGLVVVEAFKYGTPALVSSNGALKELIKYKYLGLVFQPTEEDIIYLLLSLEKTNTETRNNCIKYSSNFDTPKIVKMLKNVYISKK